MKKNTLVKLFSSFLAVSLYLTPSFASTTSIELQGNLVSVLAFNTDSADNTTYKTASIGSFPVKNEITQITNIIDFGKVDSLGISPGSGIVDQISLIKKNKLTGKKNTKNIKGSVYIIGSKETEHALKLALNSGNDFENVDITVNKEFGSNLDLYYSDYRESWSEAQVTLGDAGHPLITETPAKVKTTPGDNSILLDLAAKISPETTPARKSSTIVFTIADNENS